MKSDVTYVDMCINMIVQDKMKKYAVYVIPVFKNGWTESVENNREDAEAKRKFIEAHLRGVKVEIHEEIWEDYMLCESSKLS